MCLLQKKEAFKYSDNLFVWFQLAVYRGISLISYSLIEKPMRKAYKAKKEMITPTI